MTVYEPPFKPRSGEVIIFCSDVETQTLGRI